MEVAVGIPRGRPVLLQQKEAKELDMVDDNMITIAE